MSDTYTCLSCGREIPSINRELHDIRCQRSKKQQGAPNPVNAVSSRISPVGNVENLSHLPHASISTSSIANVGEDKSQSLSTLSGARAISSISAPAAASAMNNFDAAEGAEDIDSDDEDFLAALALSRQATTSTAASAAAASSHPGPDNSNTNQPFWTCSACTFINESSFAHCDVCGGARRGGRPPTGTGTGAGAGAIADPGPDPRPRLHPLHPHLFGPQESTTAGAAAEGIRSQRGGGDLDAPIPQASVRGGGDGEWPRQRTIQVCLIRHAQSTENVKFYAFLEMLQCMGRLQWPEAPMWPTIKAAAGLLVADGDSALADLGTRQVRDMNMILRNARFWTQQFRPDVIAYSPLKRARDTLRGCLTDADLVADFERSEVGYRASSSVSAGATATATGATGHDASSSNSSSSSSSSSSPNPPFVCLPSLTEATPAEHLPARLLRGDFLDRIASFEDWIGRLAIGQGVVQGKRLPPVQRVTVCGHSQYFKVMLKQKILFRNCDVQQVSLRVEYDRVAGNGDGDGELRVVGLHWGEPALLHRTQLAPEHPLDSIRGAPTPTPDQPTSANSARHEQQQQQEQRHNAVENDLFADGEEVVKQCRICQATTEDDPALADSLIRPCRCTGSQAYVHIGCLNQWRATSETASTQCSVCKYEYRIRTHRLVALINSQYGVLLLTAVMLLTAALVCGVALKYLGEMYQNDILAIIHRNLLAIPTSSSSRSSSRVNRHGMLTDNDWGLWWRYCSEARHEEHSELFDFLRLHSAHTNLTDKMHIALYAYFRYFLTAPTAPLPAGYVPTLLCNPFVSSACDALCLGVTAAAALGVGHIVWEKAHRLWVLHLAGGQLGLHDVLPLLMTLAWLYAQAASIGGGRLGFAIGCACAFSQTFLNMRTFGRQLASKMGETILNYNDARG